MKRKLSCVLLLISAYLVSFSTVLLAGEVRLTDMRLTNHDGKLLLSLKVKGCFTPEMEEAIVSGIPTTFTFIIELDRPKRFRGDEHIAHFKVDHTIKFDNLKCDFNIDLSEDYKSIVVKEFSEARQIMASLTDVLVTPTKNLERNARYRLKAKAELNKVKLPFYLHYILFFVRLWNFETDWVTTNFRPVDLVT
jgi:hypothetical protein